MPDAGKEEEAENRSSSSAYIVPGERRGMNILPLGLQTPVVRWFETPSMGRRISWVDPAAPHDRARLGRELPIWPDLRGTIHPAGLQQPMNSP